MKHMHDYSFGLERDGVGAQLEFRGTCALDYEVFGKNT